MFSDFKRGCINGNYFILTLLQLDDKKLNALLMKVGTNCDETFPSVRNFFL